MTPSAPKPSPVNDQRRCAQIFANSKRCRLEPRPDSEFCRLHARREDDEIAAALTGGLSDFNSLESVGELLSRLILVLAQGRISPRRAAVMAYVAGIILRTIVAIEKQKATAGATHPHRETPAPPQKIIWDIPGPAREMEKDCVASQAS